MTEIATHPSIERRLADLRRGALMRQRVTMRVARAKAIPIDTRPVLVCEALKSASNDA
jgi:hypothetical protein